MNTSHPPESPPTRKRALPHARIGIGLLALAIIGLVVIFYRTTILHTLITSSSNIAGFAGSIGVQMWSDLGAMAAVAFLVGIGYFILRHGKSPIDGIKQRENTANFPTADTPDQEHDTLRTLLDNLPDVIYVKDTQHRFTIANMSVARVMGAASTEDLIGKADLDFLPPEIARRYQVDEMAVIQSGTALINREEAIVDRQGKTHWILSTKLPLRNAMGQITGMVGIGRDITDIKQAHEHLRLQGAALASSASGIVITDRDGRIIWANEAFCQMTGYSIAEALGRNMRLVKSGNQDAAFYNQMWSAILANRVWHGELVNKRKDNTLYHEEMTITPVRDERGEISHFVAIKQNITEKKQFQQHLIQSQKMESIGRLAGGIAHDFNNALQAILGFSDILLTTVNNASPHWSDVNEIKKAAVRAASLTRQLLAFSRKQIIELNPINLNDIVRNMDGMLRRIIGENIQLQTNLDPSLSLANADASQIEAIITNLAANGHDAMPEGGRLTITTANVTLAKQDAIMMPDATPGSFVCLSISDTGKGMDNETIQHLFEPFYSTKDIGKGTGLGLATVYGIARQHNGWVNVYSQLSQGSTFKLYLPIFTGERQEQNIEETFLSENQKGHGQRILVVEDEQSVQNLATMVLRANGYQVMVASTGQEALDIFKKEKGTIDLVFTDVVLPDINGLQLAEQFLAQQPNLQLLMTSGYSDQKSRWPTIHERGWPFLQKPYPVAALLQAVAHAMQPSH